MQVLPSFTGPVLTSVRLVPCLECVDVDEQPLADYPSMSVTFLGDGSTHETSDVIDDTTSTGPGLRSNLRF